MEQTEQEKNQNEIVLKIEEIYQSKNKEGKETGKGFITHLLRSYFPMGKAQRVMDIPEKPMKCAITGQKLFAIGELWNEMHTEEFIDNHTVFQNKVEIKNGITFEDFDKQENFVRKLDALDAIKMERNAIIKELRSWFFINQFHKVNEKFAESFLKKLDEIK